jgi:GT2 family glycosyltransferase
MIGKLKMNFNYLKDIKSLHLGGTKPHKEFHDFSELLSDFDSADLVVLEPSYLMFDIEIFLLRYPESRLILIDSDTSYLINITKASFKKNRLSKICPVIYSTKQIESLINAFRFTTGSRRSVSVIYPEVLFSKFEIFINKSGIDWKSKFPAKDVPLKRSENKVCAKSCDVRSILDCENPSTFDEFNNKSALSHVSPQERANLGILIRQWDSFEMTKECIESLIKVRAPNSKIFLLDDNSSDYSYLKLFLQYPGIYLIKLFARAEYCRSFNVLAEAAERASCDNIFIINNDTRKFSEEFFSDLLTLIAKPGVGISSAKVLNYENESTHWGPRTWLGIRLDIATEGFLIPIRIWNDLGGFNNSLVRYCEDLYLVLKLQKLGLKQALSDRAEFYHLGNGSSYRLLLVPNFLFVRNIIWIQKVSGSRVGEIIFSQQTWVKILQNHRKWRGNTHFGLLRRWTLVTIYTFFGILAGIVSSPKENYLGQNLETIGRLRPSFLFWFR